MPREYLNINLCDPKQVSDAELREIVKQLLYWHDIDAYRVTSDSELVSWIETERAGEGRYRTPMS